MKQRTRIEQARADFVKTLRAAVRLKKAIEADRELNELLPAKMIQFEALVQQGKLPSPIEIKRLTEGVFDDDAS